MNFSTAFLPLFLLLTACSQASCSTITVTCQANSVQNRNSFEISMQAILDNADEMWWCGRKHLYKLTPDKQQYRQCLQNIRDIAPIAEDFYVFTEGNFATSSVFTEYLIDYSRSLCTVLNNTHGSSELPSERTFVSVTGTFEGSTNLSNYRPKSKKIKTSVASDDAKGGNGVIGLIILGLLVLVIGVACYMYFRCAKTAAAPPVDPSLKLEANHQQ